MEGAISAYGDVWQGGQWVDATADEHGFTTPTSDVYGTVSDVFSDETGVGNFNVNNPFSASGIRQNMKGPLSESFNVRKRDIDTNTFQPREGSIW